ncbi:MAG: NfeD family protein [Planctomycetaceae bacterium]
MPDAGILATVMLLVGLFLLGLEFFIPSFGMILVAAVITLIVSFWSACKAWWGVNPGFFWTYVILLTAGIPGSSMGAITLIRKTPLGNRMILNPAPATETHAPGPLDHLIGKPGISQNLMTPGGIVLIEGERIHAESLGMLIEPNSPVVVVATRANRIVVRPQAAADLDSADSAEPNPSDRQEKTDTQKPAGSLPGDSTEPDPLDFEFPQG